MNPLAVASRLCDACGVRVALDTVKHFCTAVIPVQRAASSCSDCGEIFPAMEDHRCPPTFH